MVKDRIRSNSSQTLVIWNWYAVFGPTKTGRGWGKQTKNCHHLEEGT